MSRSIEHAAWSVAAVRVAEEALMARLPESALMRRAAAGLARRCAEVLRDDGGVYGARVALLIGPGNNGGDALYAGAALARRGAVVEAFTVREAHPGGAAALREAGGRFAAADPLDDAVAERIGAADVVVDGLLGIGGRPGLRGAYAALARAAAEARNRSAVVVAVDVPSGADADTGAAPGDAVAADVTVTFGCLKPGLLVGLGASHAGLVEVVDIGLGPYLQGPPALRVATLEDVSAVWPRPGPADDKYSRGVVGIAAGSATYPGSAVLSVGGALSGPAGYLRYAGPAASVIRARYPEAVCTERVADAGRVQAWVVGSGLGTDAAAAEVVRGILDTDLPVLLDADAVTILAKRPEWLGGRAAPTLLTPHDGEFARIAGPVGDDRLGAARGAAERFGATFLLKGYRTIVASPDGRATTATTGTPALATAGSGDVLGGLAGALLAGGVEVHEAAAAAAFVHGLAGRYAAEQGPVTASRLVDALPRAVHTVLTCG